MKYLAYWNFLRLKRGGTPGAEGYISKVLWSALNQRMNEFALVLQGPRAALTEASGHEIDPGDGSMAAANCAAIRLKKVPRRFSAVGSPSVR